MLIRLDHLYLRVILAAGGRFCGDYGGDNRVKFPLISTLAFTLGGIMLLTLFLMPPLFYRAGKAPGKI